MGIFSGYNMASANALRNLSNVSSSLNKSLERLSSGYKLNRASDGSAELITSENLRAQIRGNQAAMSNVQQGLSMLNTADGALAGISDKIQRARELVITVSSDTASTEDQTAASNELTAIYAEIDSVTANTNYNDHVLLDGSIPTAGAFNIQVGANDGQQVDINSAFRDNSTAAAGLNLQQTDLSSAANRTTALGEIDAALAEVNANRAVVGQHQGTLESQLDYLSVANENLSASESLIRNTDIAQETATLARLQIQQQASAAALAQANVLPSLLLQLL